MSSVTGAHKHGIARVHTKMPRFTRIDADLIAAVVSKHGIGYAVEDESVAAAVNVESVVASILPRDDQRELIALGGKPGSEALPGRRGRG